MLSLLRQPRWLGYLALTLAFALACSMFGMWQWDRREQAKAAIQRLERNYDRAPVALADELPNVGDYEVAQQWQPVQVTGEYLAEQTLLLRGRVRGGNIGFNVIVPFQTSAGPVFLVDRGWIARGPDAEMPLTAPSIPSGQIEIVARLRANEGDIAGRGAPEGQIASVNLDTIATELGMATYTGAYGLLATENGAEPSDVALSVRPELDEGPHLSYTLQWFVFAAGGLYALVWTMRRETRGSEPAPVKRRPSDADIEDSILDHA